MKNEVFVKSKSMNNVFKYKGKMVLEIKIEYPQFFGKYPSLSEINTHYAFTAKRTERKAKRMMYPMAIKQYLYATKNGFPFNSYLLQDNFYLAYNIKKFLSTYNDLYEYTGGANGQTVRFSDTWNIMSGIRFKMKDFFVRGYDYRVAILFYIKKQVDEEVNKDPHLYFENYSKLLVKYFNENNYYITPKGMAVYYGETEIAPHSAGIPVFIIPYYIFGDNLKYLN